MKLWIPFFLITFSISAAAQEAEAIVDQYAAHLGGYAAYRKIKTAKFTCRSVFNGTDYPTTIIVLNGKGCYFEINAGKNRIRSVLYQGKGWKTVLNNGADSIVDMDQDDLNAEKSSTSLPGDLMDYKENDTRLSYNGIIKARGKDTYRIDLYDSTGTLTNKYYIDTATYMPVQIVHYSVENGVSSKKTLIPSEPEWVNGVVFFRKQEIVDSEGNVQVLLFDKIELDVPVDKNIFLKPGVQH